MWQLEKMSYSSAQASAHSPISNQQPWWSDEEMHVYHLQVCLLVFFLLFCAEQKAKFPSIGSSSIVELHHL